ncbi:MAG TPA: TIM44-like domain-containing protein [Syntrophomonadaceae bacterium]|nr:TIM44-like domain-containing protein [Syntrophomonadaceae bacterium]
MLFFIPFLFILIVIIVIVMIVKRKGGSTSYSGVDEDYGEEGPPDHDPAQVSAALDELKARDENFSEDMFISRVNNMFIQLQEAWQEKDWKKVRPFESDELFNMHAKQLQDYIRANQTNIVAEIAILKTEIVGCHEDGATESLDIYMRTRFKDYVIDDETKKVVEGDPHRENYMEYLLVMARKKGVMTKVEQNTTVSTCPNCGANVSINASGECEYCGSVVSNGDFDWVLTRMDVISQS